MLKLKLTQVGNSLGFIVPKEMIGRLNLQKGDTVVAIESREGYSLAKSDPDFERQMTVARDIMDRYRNALRELAK